MNDKLSRINELREHGMGLLEARSVIRKQDKLARLYEIEAAAKGPLRDLVRLLISEELET